jgi:hypothetical protein
VFHRRLREGAITQKGLGELLAEFDRDRQAGAFTWLPLSPTVIERVTKVYACLPATVHLRAADALHLACAGNRGVSRARTAPNRSYSNWFPHLWKYIAIRLAGDKLAAMKASVTVDEVGRLVLPKEIREAIGVVGRTSVTIEVVGQTAQITAPERPGGSVARKRGRLVFSGPVPDGWDSGDAVLRMRERRLRK